MGKNAINSTIVQIDTKNSILFIQIHFKHYYDQVYQLINLKIDNFAVLQLHKKYLIPSMVGVINKLI